MPEVWRLQLQTIVGMGRGVFHMGPCEFLSKFLDLIFPRYCLSCHAGISEDEAEYVCLNCWEKMPYIDGEICPKCGYPLGPYSSAEKGCLGCRDSDLRFDSAIAACRYEGPARELILGFKRNELAGPPLSEALIERLHRAELLSEVDIVASVPLSWRRRVKLGFNRTEMLAQRISKRFSLPLEKRNLRRVRNTVSQMGLTRAQRQDNVRGAFTVRNPGRISGKSVLLIDDVLTTGATTSECARILKQAGAKHVYVAVVARQTL